MTLISHLRLVIEMALIEIRLFTPQGLSLLGLVSFVQKDEPKPLDNHKNRIKSDIFADLV